MPNESHIVAMLAKEGKNKKGEGILSVTISSAYNSMYN